MTYWWTFAGLTIYQKVCNNFKNFQKLYTRVSDFITVSFSLLDKQKSISWLFEDINWDKSRSSRVFQLQTLKVNYTDFAWNWRLERGFQNLPVVSYQIITSSPLLAGKAPNWSKNVVGNRVVWIGLRTALRSASLHWSHKAAQWASKSALDP